MLERTRSHSQHSVLSRTHVRSTMADPGRAEEKALSQSGSQDLVLTRAPQCGSTRVTLSLSERGPLRSTHPRAPHSEPPALSTAPPASSSHVLTLSHASRSRQRGDTHVCWRRPRSGTCNRPHDRTPRSEVAPSISTSLRLVTCACESRDRGVRPQCDSDRGSRDNADGGPGVEPETAHSPQRSAVWDER